MKQLVLNQKTCKALRKVKTYIFQAKLDCKSFTFTIDDLTSANCNTDLTTESSQLTAPSTVVCPKQLIIT